MGEGNACHARTAWWVARWLYLTRVRLEVMHESATSDCGYGGHYSRRVAGRASHLIHVEWHEPRGDVRSGEDDGVRRPERQPVAKHELPWDSHHGCGGLLLPRPGRQAPGPHTIPGDRGALLRHSGYRGAWAWRRATVGRGSACRRGYRQGSRGASLAG